MSDQYRSRQERKQARQSQENKKKTKKNSGSMLKKIMIALLILGVTGALAGGITFFAMVKDAPPLDEALLKDPLSTELYDVNEKMFAEIGKEKREKVTYDEIPKVLKDAIIATEDVRFYDHFGIDFRRIGGAVIANVKEGFGAEGASTITQQVIKNAFLSPEKSIERKVQEQWLAIKLEQKYSKEQIFEMYVNKILFSGNIYGVAKASEYFFDKPLAELELPEAALLAGMPQSPNNYNPFNHPEAAEKRRNIVLSLMAKHGFITKEQAEAAKKIPVEETLTKKPEDRSLPYQAFIDEVIDEIEARSDEIGDIDVFSAGLKIYTTLDQEAQSYTEQVLNTNDVIKYPSEKFQAAVVLLDTETGEVRAIGDGRNRHVFRGLSLATEARRQPGSTIKPILDYGPAIEYLKWSTYEQIVDEPHTYTNGPAIKNADSGYKGQMTIRYALQWSRNIPALKTFQEVGASRAKEFGEKLGISPKELSGITEAYSIGGFDNGVTPMELAGAYSAFGNDGIFNKPHTVKKVVFPDGTEINFAPKPKVAMKDYTAYMVTDMLKTVVKSGTGSSVGRALPGLSVAGKTGTTNYTSEEKKKYNVKRGAAPDIWFAGYTTKYTAAVWTGYEERKNSIDKENQDIARKIFSAVMKNVSKDVKTPDFKRPKSVVEVAVEKGTNPPKLASEFTPKEEVVHELFIRGTEPTEVSEQYNKIPAPANVTANYNQQYAQIMLQWQYPQEQLDRISFKVEASVNGSPFTEIATTKELAVGIEEVQPEATYQFKVTAFSNENPTNMSDPVLVQIQVPTDGDGPITDPFDGGNDDDGNGDDGDNGGGDDATGGEDGNNDGNNGNGNDNNNDGNDDGDTNGGLGGILPGRRNS